MKEHDDHALTLPPQAVANPEFPYAPQLDSARRFLAARGITQVHAVYGTPHAPRVPQGRVRILRLAARLSA